MDVRSQRERAYLRQRLAVLEARLYKFGEERSRKPGDRYVERALERVAEEYDRAAQRFYNLGGEPSQW